MDMKPIAPIKKPRSVKIARAKPPVEQSPSEAVNADVRTPRTDPLPSADAAQIAVPKPEGAPVDEEFAATSAQPDFVAQSGDEEFVPRRRARRAGESAPPEDAAPAARRTTEHRPDAQAPVTHKPAVHKAAVYKPAVHKPAVHKPAVHKPVVHKPAVHEPVVHKPVVYRPAVHEPVVYRPSVHEPVVHEPGVHEPAARKPAVHKAAVHKAAVHKPAARKSAVHESAAPKRPHRRVGPWTVAVIALLFCVLGGMSYVAYGEAVQYAKYRKMVDEVDALKFARGIQVDKIALQGLTQQEAKAKLRQHADKLADAFELTIEGEDKRWKLDAEKAGFTTDMEEVLLRAYSVGRHGSLEDRYQTMLNPEQKTIPFALTTSYDEDKLRGYIEEIAGEIDIPVVNSSVKDFDTDSKKFSFTAAEAGKRVDMDKLFADVKQRLDEKNYGGSAIRLSMLDVEPTVTASDLKSQFGRISSMSTKTTAVESRNKNITLASNAVSGTRLAKGEVFSFNATTGERTTEKGYEEAGAISNGVPVQEPGGGVCQVSTTLFNAAAMADLTILERSPHSWPSDYVSIGRDAAVSWPSQDLKFCNDKDTPVYIVMWYSRNKVYAEIYGEKLPDGMKISVTSERTSTWDPEGEMRTQVNRELKPGASRVISKARKGYTAVAYRVYKDSDGDVIKTEELCKSKYDATAGVREVGPKR